MCLPMALTLFILISGNILFLHLLGHRTITMASLVDSRAHFESRASEYGVPNDLVVALAGAWG